MPNLQRRRLRCITALSVAIAFLTPYATKAQKKPEPPSITALRKKLQTRISVDFKDTRLEDCLKEITNQVDGLNFYRGAGVSNNMTFTYQAKDQPVEAVLRGMFKGRGLGYVLHRATKPGDRYDGWVQVVQGDVFGEVDPPLEEKPVAKPTEKPSETKTKPTTRAVDPAKLERAARAALNLARAGLDRNDIPAAEEVLEFILKNYPDTQAAEEAQELLKKIKK